MERVGKGPREERREWVRTVRDDVWAGSKEFGFTRYFQMRVITEFNNIIQKF